MLCLNVMIKIYLIDKKFLDFVIVLEVVVGLIENGFEYCIFI